MLEDKKLENIITISLKGKSNLADFLMIASGSSKRQLAVASELVALELKKKGFSVSIEGLAQCDWVLVDVGCLIIHLFRPEVREFYNLEKMWGIE